MTEIVCIALKVTALVMLPTVGWFLTTGRHLFGDPDPPELG